MLRSLDHVGRSAARRVARDAATDDDGHARRRDRVAPDRRAEHVGLDVDAWIERARERFLEAYRDGLREARVWIDTDADLLRAFEVDKELYEFAYAATYLPSWLYAPTEGMRALVGRGRPMTADDRLARVPGRHRGLAGGAGPPAGRAAADAHRPARRLCLDRPGQLPLRRRHRGRRARGRGRTAWSELASGAARTRPAADLTLVAISASGGTPEVVEVARRHRGTSQVIAVTNRPDSALAGAADQTHRAPGRPRDLGRRLSIVPGHDRRAGHAHRDAA